MFDIKSVVNKLDEIASRVETIGCMREATEIDIISNTLESEAAKKKEKWIQKAVPESHEGKFEEWCKRNGFKGVCQECINKAVNKGGHAQKMALFAVNVSKGKYTYPDNA